MAIEEVGSKEGRGQTRFRIAFSGGLLLLAMSNLRVMTLSYAFGTNIKIASGHKVFRRQRPMLYITK